MYGPRPDLNARPEREKTKKTGTSQIAAEVGQSEPKTIRLSKFSVPLPFDRVFSTGHCPPIPLRSVTVSDGQIRASASRLSGGATQVGSSMPRGRFGAGDPMCYEEPRAT